MFKYKKIILYLMTFLFLIFSLIELIIYFTVDNSIFGLIYLLNNLLIIFLLVPCAYNYKKFYNPIRISKLIFIILFGIFNSFILNKLVLDGILYVDDSSTYISKIFIYKNIFKTIIYFVLFIITIFEFRIDKLVNIRKAKNLD